MMNKRSNFNSAQKGQAILLSIIVLSVVMVTSLMAAYVYTENRIRFHAQIKEAYKLAEATEAAAKSIKNIWDQANSRVTPGGPITCMPWPCTPDTLFTQVILPMVPGGSLCFENADSVNPYCFTLAFDSNLKNINTPLKDHTRLEKFLAKLDDFFDAKGEVVAQELNKAVKRDPLFELKPPTLLGWVMREKYALAHSGPGAGHAPTEPGGPPPIAAETGTGTALPGAEVPNCRSGDTTSASCSQCNTNNTAAIGATDSFQHQSRCLGINFGAFNQSVRIPTGADKF